MKTILAFLFLLLALFLSTTVAVAQADSTYGLIRSVPGSTRVARWQWVHARLPSLLGLSKSKAALALGVPESELKDGFSLLISKEGKGEKIIFRVGLRNDIVYNLSITRESESTLDSLSNFGP
jgi:hypothetical protein